LQRSDRHLRRNARRLDRRQEERLWLERQQRVERLIQRGHLIHWKLRERLGLVVRLFVGLRFGVHVGIHLGIQLRIHLRIELRRDDGLRGPRHPGPVHGLHDGRPTVPTQRLLWRLSLQHDDRQVRGAGILPVAPSKIVRILSHSWIVLDS
jgi:hypothetical protein